MQGQFFFATRVGNLRSNLLTVEVTRAPAELIIQCYSMMKKVYPVLIVLAIVLTPIKSANAATKTWIGSDGLFWNNSAAWSLSGVPVNGDDVVMGTQSAVTSNVLANFTSTYTGPGLNSLKINSTGIGGTFTLSQTLAASAMIATTEIVGDTITQNVYTQNAGSNTTSTLTIGNGAGGGGTYTLSGAGTLNVATFVVGNAGFGTVNFSGGTINLTNFMGISQTNNSSTSNFNMTGGTLAVASGAYFAVGASRGNFNQSGGAVSFAGPNGFYVGNGTTVGVNNTYTLSGTGLITNANFESLGQSLTGGTATFTQTGGTNSFQSGGALTVGDQGAGAYNLSGGTLTTSVLNIGNATGITGTFSQTGGANSFSSFGILNLGQNAGATGIYTMDNSVGSSTLNVATENIGVSGTGTMTQNAGTNTTLQLTIGSNLGASGTYNLNGGNLSIGTGAPLSAGVLVVGQGATGALFNQTAGSNALNGVGSAVYIAYNAGSSGTYLLKGGTLSTDSLYVGVFGTGSMTQSGGTNTITNNSFSSGLYVGYGGQGAYTLNSNNSASSLSATNETIGVSAQGTVNQRGNSTNTVAGLLTIGGGVGGNGIYSISAGTLTAQSTVVGYNGGVGTVNESGISNVTVQAGGLVLSTFGGVGAFNLSGGTLTTPSTAGGFVVNPSGSFNQTGGTYNGYLNNNGVVSYGGGTFSGTLENDLTGSLTLTATLVAGGGVINKGFITIPTAGGLGSGTTGLGILDNQNSITLTGGSLAGTGAITNNGTITGFGTIGGSGGFTNFGLFTQGNGTLTITNTAPNTNLGTMTLAAGHQVQLTTGSLNNSALLTLNDAIVTGAGTLANLGSGTLSGGGTISSTFQNNGTIVPGSNALNIVNGWANAGIIQLTGPLSSVVGGLINNTGTIQGIGSIGAAVANNGSIEALGGGTLALTGALSNAIGGSILASTGNKVLVQNGLTTNAGLINLTGGIFDNNNRPLTNNAGIVGYGTFRTGGAGLTNAGSITFTGGNTTVNGNVTNNAGQTVRISYNAATFTGNVINNGTFKTTSTTATFAGTFTNNGVFTSDPATQQFQNLNIGAGGALQGGVGDVFVINGQLNNQSLASTSFDIAHAQLTLSTGVHDFTWSALERGATAAGYANNFVIGTFELQIGATLNLLGAFASGSANALYVHGLSLDGGLAQLASIHSNGLNIYYDGGLAENAYLAWGTYALEGGGSLIAVAGVPEPGTVGAFIVGAFGLLVVRHRFSRRMP